MPHFLREVIWRMEGFYWDVASFLGEVIWRVEVFYWDVVYATKEHYSGTFGTLLSAISWFSIPLLAFSVWLLVRSVKRQNRLRLRSLVVPLVTTVLVPLAYVAILGADPPRLVSGALLVLGLGVGVLWANTTSLALREGQVYGVRSVGYLFVWGLAFILSQALVLGATAEVVRYGLSTLYLSMGVSLGTNGNLLYRRFKVQSGRPDAPIGPALRRPQKTA